MIGQSRCCFKCSECQEHQHPKAIEPTDLAQLWPLRREMATLVVGSNPSVGSIAAHEYEKSNPRANCGQGNMAKFQRITTLEQCTGDYSGGPDSDFEVAALGRFHFDHGAISEG